MNNETQPERSTEGKFVVMPAPTAWPFAMAMGTALTFTGLLTNASVSVLGAILTIFGAVGWFREVLPHEHHEPIALKPEEPAAVVPPPRGHADGSGATGTARLAAAQDLSHLGGRERRPRRWRRHGHPRRNLWRSDVPQRVVSH